jgi:hypothetical protein
MAVKTGMQGPRVSVAWVRFRGDLRYPILQIEEELLPCFELDPERANWRTARFCLSFDRRAAQLETE